MIGTDRLEKQFLIRQCPSGIAEFLILEVCRDQIYNCASP
jgi:hypothetical protein